MRFFISFLAIFLANATHACVRDVECNYPARCVLYRGESEGTCAGGYREDSARHEPVDIYGGAARGLDGIAEMIRAKKARRRAAAEAKKAREEEAKQKAIENMN